MNTKLINIIVLVLCLNSGCDCYQNVSGQVLDSQTKEPLTGVKIVNVSKIHTTTQTDFEGKFSLSSVSGVIVCPPMEIELSKINYSTKRVKIPSGTYKLIEIEPQ